MSFERGTFAVTIFELPDKLPDDFRGIMERDGLERAVTDYVSGMTDDYAIYQYGEIFIPMAWSVK